MTLQETLDFADSRIAVWWPMIQQVQASYFQQHGRYAQALELADEMPADGGVVPVTRAEEHPTDQAETPADLLNPLPSTLRTQFRLDVYCAPDGWGYAGVFSLIFEGTTYQRQIGEGVARSHDWMEVTDGAN